MDKEKAKNILFNILVDLTYVECDIDIREVGPILEKHLGLDAKDSKEVMDRYVGEIRERYISQSEYAGSNLEQALAQWQRSK